MRPGQDAMTGARPSVWEAETKTWRFKFPLTTMFLLAEGRRRNGEPPPVAQLEVVQQSMLCSRGYRLDGEYLQRRCVEHLLGRP